MGDSTNFEERVYAACSKIKKGRVSTYSEIAKAIGNPKAARAVGNALHKNPYKRVPCHRVVCSDGRIGGFAHGSRRKIRMLRNEDLKIIKGKLTDFENKFQKIK